MHILRMRLLRVVAALAVVFMAPQVEAGLLLPAAGVSASNGLLLPAVQLYVNEERVGDGSVREIGKDGSFGSEFSFEGAGFEMNGGYFGNVDPFLGYGFGVSNFTNSVLNVLIIFSTPYLGGPYNTLESSHSSSVTDSGANPSGTIAVTPAVAAGIHVPVLDGSPVNAAALGTGCNLAGAPGFSASCNTNSLVSVGVSSLANGILSVTIGFNLSPGDIYTGNGRVEIKNVAVPEPATMALVGLGFVAFVGIRRRA